MKRSHQSGRLPAPFDGARVRYFVNGRAALWHAIRALGFPPGVNVLVPAYQCGTELDAVMKAEVAVKSYRVDRRLAVDLDDLREAIDAGTKAVLVTHYFGFPQRQIDELAAQCRERGLILIEDCAHALYSARGERPLGTFGDLAVFSLHKSLAVPSGGVVLVNNEAIDVPQAAELPPPLPFIERFKREAIHTLRGIGPLRRAYRYLRGTPAPAPVAAPLASNDLAQPRPFDPAMRTRPISPGALDALQWTDPVAVRETRRRNYQYLAAELAGEPHVQPLLAELPRGACPLQFPLLVEHPEALHDYVLQSGLRSTVWWRHFDVRFPAELYPEATYLKRHILALPIRHDIGLDQLGRAVHAVRSWRPSAHQPASLSATAQGQL